MWLFWTVTGAATLYFLINYLTRRKKCNFPPSPPGLPLIGNLLQIDKNAPHHTLTKWSEKYGDVFSINLFGRCTVVLNSFETIYEGLVTNANHFAGRTEYYRMKAIVSNCPDIVTSTFSPKWMHTKKTAMQILKLYGDNLENLEEITLQLIADMIEELNIECHNGPIDIYPIYHRCTTGIISSILYGYRVGKDKVEVLLKDTNASFDVLRPIGMGLAIEIIPLLRRLPITINQKLSTVSSSVRNWINTEVKDRKLKYEYGNPQCVVDALLDQQLKGRETGESMQLTDDDIFGINHNIVFAGTFTTSITLRCLIAVLVNKPDLQQYMAKMIKAEIGQRQPRLTDRAKLHYIQAAILEILRYSSIIPLNLPHTTTKDTTIHGFDIPKGTEVLFNLWKLHHSEEYWDEPWEFKPERYLDEHGEIIPPGHMNRKRLLAFGASRRVCLGEVLAKNRLFLMVTALLQNFQFLPAGPDEHPLHDPRDYITIMILEPPNYRVKLIPRL